MEKMSKKIVRVISVVAGVLLIVSGIYCIFREDVALMTGAVILGLSMLLSGVLELVIFAKAGGTMLGSGWLLLDGLLTVILSLFMLFNGFFTLLYMPFLFSAWLMFSGIFRIVSAVDMRAFGARYWWVTLIFAIVLTVVGFLGFMDPWVSLEAMSITIGIVFILEGLDSIIAGFNSPSRDI